MRISVKKLKNTAVHYLFFCLCLSAVCIMAVIPAKADVILLGASGNKQLSFTELNSDSYKFTETYSLFDPDTYFTSFSIDPGSLLVQFAAFINNFGLDSIPAVDASGLYNGTFTFKAGLDINGTHFDLGKYSTDVSGIDYTPDFLELNKIGVIRSQDFNADFSGLPIVSFGEAELSGINSITVLFTLSSVAFFTDMQMPNDTASGWVGNIKGNVGVAWTSNAPPTPEPATMLIFGISAAGAGVVAWRKRRMKK